MTQPTPEEIVASPAVTGDLDKEMKAVAKPVGKVTLILGGILVVAVAFGGGAWTHSALAGSSTPSRTGQARPSGQPQAPGGQGRQGGFGRGGTAGTIERVDGSTIYVKTMQGTEVAVSTSDSTTVNVTQPGKVTDLKTGATVLVQGQAGADGKVAAQSITQQPARSGG
ncbi:hypothetical protein SAMN05421504_10642 [Amycolatopsis xylanica]|uniref:DUF5666 domain-containing protein n=1 Tax=Amycolatopsis xylanica TaxID=589385 RepID=A0A1H3L313_9PSEU|nr:hypothetical protein [Amycolatopsis xylanica]SDY58822.1 hypothetical protein SAMN05421504_10642 [Amycolatopsis xylanica]